MNKDLKRRIQENAEKLRIINQGMTDISTIMGEWELQHAFQNVPWKINIQHPLPKIHTRRGK